MSSGPPSWLQELKLAQAHAAAGRLVESEAVLRQILKADPNQADALNALASFAANAGKLDIAITLQERALAARPNAAPFRSNLSEMHRRLADALQARGDLAGAEAALRRALELAPDRADMANALGIMLSAAGRQQEAVAFLERAAAQGGHAELWTNLGTVLKEVGRFDEALTAFERAAVLDPRSAAPLLGIAETKTFRDPADAHLTKMEALARDVLPEQEQIYLRFALGKAYDDLGRADAAFEQFRAGNTLKRRSVGYNEAAALGLFERVARMFDAALLSGAHGANQDAAPIFVIGMPRSGTTLVEQIISNHPDVAAAGEIPAMNNAVRMLGAFPEDVAAADGAALARIGDDYLRALRTYAPNAVRITDKTPSNMLFVGLIHLMLPNAAIVHVERDPVDTCLSCYSRLFIREMGQTYDLGELGRYYQAYHALMRHWDEVLPAGRVLRVRYEDVVADIEGQARRLLAHCGLPWDARVLAFHQNTRVVSTASASQVRQPIYATSVARWRRYEAHLGPLLEALGELVES